MALNFAAVASVSAPLLTLPLGPKPPAASSSSSSRSTKASESRARLAPTEAPATAAALRPPAAALAPEPPPALLGTPTPREVAAGSRKEPAPPAGPWLVPAILPADATLPLPPPPLVAASLLTPPRPAKSLFSSTASETPSTTSPHVPRPGAVVGTAPPSAPCSQNPSNNPSHYPNSRAPLQTVAPNTLPKPSRNSSSSATGGGAAKNKKLEDMKKSLGIASGGKTTATAGLKPLNKGPTAKPTAPPSRPASSASRPPPAPRGSIASLASNNSSGALASFKAAFGEVVQDVQLDTVESSYKDLADEEQWNGLQKVLGCLEQKDQLAQKLDSVKVLEVKAFKCADCGRLTEKREFDCRHHMVKEVKAMKRWWTCGHCQHHFTTLAVVYPSKRCPKCNDPGMEFAMSSMYRPTRADKEAPANIACRENMLARGVEHGRFLS